MWRFIVCLSCSFILIELPYNHTTFFVRAEVFHSNIVASHSCTIYLWGTLIALCRAVHQAQFIKLKFTPF